MFKNVGVFGKHHRESVADTVEAVAHALTDLGAELTIAQESIETSKFRTLPLKEMIQKIDLLVVVGGDGSLIHAARKAAAANKPIVGINRGRLGFLTDIAPQDAKKELEKILAGKFKTEKRTLLESWITPPDETSAKHYLALNDVVLFPSDTAQMIEFEVYVNDELAFAQRSDGLIIATPTGSSAYALSAGGPLVTPDARVFVLVPKCPHMLTSRPVAIEDNSTIRIKILSNSAHPPRMSCDGQLNFTLTAGQEIVVRRFKDTLTLLHPEGYNYFKVLQEKLGWHAELRQKKMVS